MDDQVPEDLRVTEIERDFPSWGVWISDTGNWWASLRCSLTSDQVAAGCTPYLCAADADELVELLADREALMSEAATVDRL